MARVLVAMSGGVDSSVAAWLLACEGHEVTGVFMRHGFSTSDAASRGCCNLADAEDARQVAAQLGIPFYSLNLQQEFGRVVDYFAAEYQRGRTPNPCVMCNTWLKFGRLFDFAEGLGADFVATGHYARVRDEGEETELLTGVDPDKDQSYVLFGVSRRRLRQLRLPIGEFTKSKIRQFAADARLPVAEKPDSQEICFVPDNEHANFLRSRSGWLDTSGPIATSDGRVVGQHAGLEHFTIGQRKGLGIAFGQPYYVSRIEPATHTVVVGPRADLARQELVAADANWLFDPPQAPFRCNIKIRYRSRPVPAIVTPQDGLRWHARFEQPCEAVTPGQAAVCYDGERVLGGGWIDSVH